MQLIQLALGALTLSPIVSAGCFSGGQPWGNKPKANGYLDGICADWSSSSMSPSTTRSVCKNGDSGTRFNFSVKNISNGARTISKAECIDGLQKEINKCNTGGKTAYTNWEYT